MRILLSLSVAVALAGYGAVSSATEGVSLERGREIFEDQKLGKSGKSCATCHPGGRNLEWAGTYDAGKLADINNRCIQKALQGKPLPEDSGEMQSLILYLKSFAGPGR